MTKREGPKGLEWKKARDGSGLRPGLVEEWRFLQGPIPVGTDLGSDQTDILGHDFVLEGIVFASCIDHCVDIFDVGGGSTLLEIGGVQFDQGLA